MKIKSLIQILIPFACTVILWAILGIVGFSLESIGHDIRAIRHAGEFLQIDIFQLHNGDLILNTVLFWIINILSIIILEITFTNTLEEIKKNEFGYDDRPLVRFIKGILNLKL